MKRIVLNYLVIAALAVSAVCISCQKDMENANTVKLLKTITYESDRSDKHVRYKFEYDKQNRITKIYEYDRNISFTYAGNDLVQVLYNYSSGSVEMYEYTKSGNTITEKYTYNGDGTISNFTNTSSIKLDSDGLPVKKEVESPFFHVYEYQGGNLTINRITYTTPQEYDPTETLAYTYDNEKGALYYCQTPKWYLILYLNNFGIKNNVTYSGGTNPPRSEYTYEYDITGFPAKRTHQTSGHMTYSEGTEEFSYITK